MIDPPRPGVPEAVRKCQSAGIQVVMVCFLSSLRSFFKVTGDHPLTAKAIARQVNIIAQRDVVNLLEEPDTLQEDPNGPKAIVVHGQVLEKLTDAQLDFIVKQFDQVIL